METCKETADHEETITKEKFVRPELGWRNHDTELERCDPVPPRPPAATHTPARQLPRFAAVAAAHWNLPSAEGSAAHKLLSSTL